MKTPVLGESPKLRYFTFFYLYVIQGIPAGFALTALANYLIAKQVAPERVGTFIALDGLPWILQFVWGPIIDRFQYSSMGNRKHWVVFSQWAAIAVTSLLCIVKKPELEVTLLSAIFFTHSIFASIQIASVDAMAIVITPQQERGRVNGFMRGGFLLGMAFSSTVFSGMLHRFTFQQIAILQTAVLSGFALLFFFTKLERSNTLLPQRMASPLGDKARSELSFKTVFQKVFHGITNSKSLRYFGLVALVYFCTSVFIRSYTFHLINVIKWTDNQVSMLQGGWGSILTLVAILVAGGVSDKIGHKALQVKVMWVVCIFLLVINITAEWWTFRYYSGLTLVLWNLADPLLSVTIFPILMALCVKKVEGSQFTAYLALINLCDVAGSYITGWSLKAVTAPVLSLICASALLLVLMVQKFRSHYSVIPNV